MFGDTVKVTEAQKRRVPCPRCGARSGKACRSSRIPGANTFGGGRGGPPDLDRAHAERRAEYLERRRVRWFVRDLVLGLRGLAAMAVHS